jgi:hypothetical protein
MVPYHLDSVSPDGEYYTVGLKHDLKTPSLITAILAAVR